MSVRVGYQFSFLIDADTCTDIPYVVMDGMWRQAKLFSDLWPVHPLVHKAQNSHFSVRNLAVEPRMTDDVFVLALTTKGARDVLEMELPAGIHIACARVDDSEVAFAKAQGDSVLIVLKIRLTTLVLFGAGIEGIGIELLKMLYQVPNNLPVALGKPMLATVFVAIPDLIFERIELNVFHQGLG